MRFDELAKRAGETAAGIGSRSIRPTVADMLARQRRRRQVTAWSAAGALALAVFVGAQLSSGQGAVPPGAGETTTSSVGPTTSTTAATTTTTVPVTTTISEPMPVAREECPVTVSGDTPFTPADQTPQPPLPDSYLASWFGTPDLWTFVYDAGQVWDGLPVTPEGTRTHIIMWWSRNLDIHEEEEPAISMTAEHILGSPSTFIEEGRVTTGANLEMGEFALVRLDFPHDGCWRITAEYEGAIVSYVAWVEGRE